MVHGSLMHANGKISWYAPVAGECGGGKRFPYPFIMVLLHSSLIFHAEDLLLQVVHRMVLFLDLMVLCLDL